MRRLCYTLFFMLIASVSSAQSLENTRWKSYYSAINDTISVTIKNDTFSATSSFGLNLVTSWISETNDSMLIADVSGPSNICPLDDTAYYAFSIDADTLEYQVLVDSCSQRQSVLNGAVLWRDDSPPSGISAVSFRTNGIYPNPSLGYVMIDEPGWNLTIFDLQGRRINSIENVPSTTRLSLDLNEGIYLYLLTKGSDVITDRIIIAQ